MELREGKDLEDDARDLIAICCAADISAEAKTHFLHVNNEDSGLAFDAFVFVDSLTVKYTTEDLEDHEFEASDPESPFKDQSADECSALLTRLAENTGAYTLDAVFGVYDQRSTQDGSILLVQWDEDKLESMRCVPELACTKLLQYMTGDASIAEDREETEEEEDGVFRLNEEFL